MRTCNNHRRDFKIEQEQIPNFVVYKGTSIICDWLIKAMWFKTQKSDTGTEIMLLGTKRVADCIKNDFKLYIICIGNHTVSSSIWN